MSTIYQLIYIVPDRVLRWIGGDQEALGDMGAEQQSKAAFGAVISSTTSATSSTTANMAGGKAASEKEKLDNKDTPTTPAGSDIEKNAGNPTGKAGNPKPQEDTNKI